MGGGGGGCLSVAGNNPSDSRCFRLDQVASVFFVSSPLSLLFFLGYVVIAFLRLRLLFSSLFFLIILVIILTLLHGGEDLFCSSANQPIDDFFVEIGINK